MPRREDVSVRDRRFSGRRTLDSFFFLPRTYIHRLALHAGCHALMTAAFELDGGARFRDLPAEEQVVSIAALGIYENVAIVFDRVLDAAGTAHSLRLSCGLV